MSNEDLISMTDEELWAEFEEALRAQVRARAVELAAFPSDMGKAAEAVLRGEDARQRQDAIEAELVRRR